MGKMFERRLARIEEAVEERRRSSDGAKDWLLREIRLIKERNAAWEARLPEAERQAAHQASRERRAALAATAPTPEEAERLARLAEASGDIDDTRAAMLAHIRLLVARAERPDAAHPQTPQPPHSADTER